MPPPALTHPPQNFTMKIHPKHSPRWAPNSWEYITLALILATVILLIRKADSLTNPQFWAEDGVIFFFQQYEHGPTTILQPYEGYFLLIPRLIALFTDLLFPYSMVPTVYNFSSLLITLLVVASVFSPRLSIKNKLLFAITPVLIPHFNNEVFLNISNLQWITALLLVITLIKKEPDLKYGNKYLQITFDVSILILCGLTGPFLLLLFPLFIWKWFRNKIPYNFYNLIIITLISLPQLSFILQSPLILGNANSTLTIPTLSNLETYSALIGYKIFGNLFLGSHLPYFMNHDLLSLLYIGLIFVLTIQAVKSRSFIHLTFLYIHVVILLASVYKVNPEALILPGGGTRYFYLPHIMIVWYLIVLLGQTPKIWKNALLAIALLAVSGASISSGFQSQLIDYQWNYYSEFIGKEIVDIPINPTGWKLRIRPHP